MDATSAAVPSGRLVAGALIDEEGLGLFGGIEKKPIPPNPAPVLADALDSGIAVILEKLLAVCILIIAGHGLLLD
jgi:hypothetical protein